MYKLKIIRLVGLMVAVGFQIESIVAQDPTFARFGESGPVSKFVHDVQAQKLSRSLESFVLASPMSAKAVIAWICKFGATGLLFWHWVDKSGGLLTPGHGPTKLKTSRSVDLQKVPSLGQLPADAQRKLPSFARIGQMMVYLYFFYAITSSLANGIFGQDICCQLVFDNLVKHIQEHKLLEVPNHGYIKHLLEIIYKGQDLLSSCEKIQIMKALKYGLKKIKTKKNKPLEILFFVDGQYYSKEV